MITNWDMIIAEIDHPDGAEMVYERALKYSKELPEDYIFMEIGCCYGGMTMLIMQAVKDSGVDRWVWSVDPYGSMPFRLGTGILEEADYNESIYRRAMYNFATFAKQLGVKHYHWRMTSEDFMNTVESVQFWDKGTTITPKFGFVYIDGAHDGEVVEKEMLWLVDRMPKGKSMIGLDDVPYITMNNKPIIEQAVRAGEVPEFRAFWEVT